MTAMNYRHIPVFLEQAVDALRVREGGVYIDCTAGGGGHSRAILERLGDGRLIAVDRDPQAVSHLETLFAGDARVRVVHGNFKNIKAILSGLEVDGADGILADLGVSSHQIDTPERGFSYHADAPLDMRMSMEGPDAAQLVNTAPYEQLRDILRDYGEEKFAAAIARAIVQAREKEPLNSTAVLADIVKSSIPAPARRQGGNPAKRTFQALRIAVNGELEGLREALDDMFGCLNVQGRLTVITFHSLEDRTVKAYFASKCSGCTCPPDFPVCVCGRQAQARLPHKALKPDDKMIRDNPRCRSAKLRTIEKVRKEPF
ncbi:MAG: Ribosomal RNA small subunit methyltransferase H [Firmicutes bacterium ADurb.Bin262]|nr:MAG: Ribosomal RNA small subunit methyltransferase H [Firmicutes bacterium ADurb.Bin262]